MRIFTLGDLHLSHQVEKPMDVFGGHWLNHAGRIRENWGNTVSEGDVVIMPGDFSWATYLEQAEEDFRFLGNLPGRKIVLKGNHDYWWETVTKMKNFLDGLGIWNIDFLYNNSYCFEGICICGTKGWDNNEEKDEKIINRETSRFRLSLESIPEEAIEIIAVFHYPPDENPVFLDILNEHKIKKCIYGHKHGYSEEPRRYLSGGIEYINASADQVGFTPVAI
jgi:predicted phosphohydrolase